MKNVHVLPTRKVKRLKISNKEIEHEIFKSELYITNDEVIKEGDWHFKNDKMVTKSYIIDDTCKKIILTTDQDLINDGVQAIDENFLEWFYGNQSCEEVEIETWKSLAEFEYFYQIKIPHEEKDKNKYSLEDMKLAFETGRNFQITAENNFNELIKDLKNK